VGELAGISHRVTKEKRSAVTISNAGSVRVPETLFKPGQGPQLPYDPAPE